MLILSLVISLLQFDSLQTLVVKSSQTLFSKAVSLSTGIDGSIYVIDQNANTLNAVSTQNMIIRSVGGKGWGSETFERPSDVTSTFLLDILVADANNMRVQRYDHQFNFVRTYDGSESGAESFRPAAASTSAQGDLYILDKDGKRVVVLNTRGMMLRDIGSFKDSKAKLNDPKDIAVSSDDNVLVLDGHVVHLYDIFGNVIRSIKLGANDWQSLSISHDVLLVTAPDRIALIDLRSDRRSYISTESVMGAVITEPFSDAVLQGSDFILLTQTTLYRCSFP